MLQVVLITIDLEKVEISGDTFQMRGECGGE